MFIFELLSSINVVNFVKQHQSPVLTDSIQTYTAQKKEAKRKMPAEEVYGSF